jgi:hypothetical protein
MTKEHFRDLCRPEGDSGQIVKVTFDSEGKLQCKNLFHPQYLGFPDDPYCTVSGWRCRGTVNPVPEGSPVLDEEFMNHWRAIIPEGEFEKFIDWIEYSFEEPVMREIKIGQFLSWRKPWQEWENEARSIIKKGEYTKLEYAEKILEFTARPGGREILATVIYTIKK